MQQTLLLLLRVPSAPQAHSALRSSVHGCTDSRALCWWPLSWLSAPVAPRHAPSFPPSTQVASQPAGQGWSMLGESASILWGRKFRCVHPHIREKWSGHAARILLRKDIPGKAFSFCNPGSFWQREMGGYGLHSAVRSTAFKASSFTASWCDSSHMTKNFHLPDADVVIVLECGEK